MLLSSYQQCCITVFPFCSFVAKLNFMIHDWRNSRPRCRTTEVWNYSRYVWGYPLFGCHRSVFFAGWDSRHVGSGKSTFTCQLEVCWRKPSFTAVTTSFLDSIGISEDTERFWLLEACAADSVYRDDQALLLSQESARAQAEEMRLSALLEVDGHGTVWWY